MPISRTLSVPTFVSACALIGCASFLGPNNVKHTDAEYNSFKNTELSGYDQDREQDQTGSLAAPSKVILKAKGGSCSRAVFRIAEGAKYSSKLKNINFYTQKVGSGNAYVSLPGLRGPGGIAALGCYRTDTDVTFWMTDQGRGTALGSGDYALQVWHKPASEQEIAAYENQEAQVTAGKERMAQREAEEQQRKEEGCATCKAEYSGCKGAGRDQRTCQDEFSSCAFQKVGASYLSTCKRPQ